MLSYLLSWNYFRNKGYACSPVLASAPGARACEIASAVVLSKNRAVDPPTVQALLPFKCNSYKYCLVCVCVCMSALSVREYVTVCFCMCVCVYGYVFLEEILT